MNCGTLGFPVLQYLLSLFKLMFIELVVPSNHLILCCPFFSCLQSFPASVFSNESALRIRWPKYWSFSFSSSPSNEYSGFISFRVDWFDLLIVQGTLRSLLQRHSLKASIRHSAFFIVQLLILFLLLWICLFWTFRISETVQCVSFCVWLI